MADEPTFEDFIRRIRAGDEQAAVELVRRYEPTIRVEVRANLTDPGLYRLFGEAKRLFALSTVT
jgi:hypothetical protein